MHVTLARMLLSLAFLSHVATELDLGVAKNESQNDSFAVSARQDGPDAYRVYRVTAYCDRGTTASGVPSGMGQCAAPADIPFGTKIYIPELSKYFVVTDRTAERFRHNTVDLFMPTNHECKQFGAHFLECHIFFPDKRLPYGAPELLREAAAHRRVDTSLSDM